MVRNSRQHWASSWKLAFAEGRVGLTEPRLRRWNSRTLVCHSSPQSFFRSSWCCGDTEDNEEEISGHQSPPIKAHRDTLTDFLVEPFSFTIAYVDPDIAGIRVGENNTQLFSLHWPGVDESILLIVTSIVDMTILSMVIAPIDILADPSQTIHELWDCWMEANGHGGLHTSNVTPNFDINTAAWWVKVTMKFNNPLLLCNGYCCQQVDGTPGAQAPMCGGRRYLSLGDIPPPSAEDMIEDIREKSDDDADSRCQNPRCFLTTKTGFWKFARILQMRSIGLQGYLECNQNRALGLFADQEQSILANKDVAWLREHNHIVNSPAAGCLANFKHTSSRLAANQSLWGWNALVGLLFKDFSCEWVFFWHFGRWMDGR